MFASVGAGVIALYTPRGDALTRLRTRTRSSEEKGLCFDAAGNLYVTNFDASTMSKFDGRGRLVQDPWGGRFDKDPESCAADAAGRVYVGEAQSARGLLKFTPSGKLLATYKPRGENEGVNWIDLAADQCTLFYTSAGRGIKRFDVCRGRQLPDFARVPDGQCYALRLRPNGEALVACSARVYRLDKAGRVLRAYTARALGEKSILYALALDQDGASFWTAGFESGHVYHVDIATGRVLGRFTEPPYQVLGGLAVVGDVPAAQLTPRSPACRPYHTALPLIVNILAAPAHSHQLTVRLLTQPRAQVSVALQVATARGVYRTLTGVARADLMGATDEYGVFIGAPTSAYLPSKPTPARLIVTVYQGCASATRTLPLTLRP